MPRVTLKERQGFLDAASAGRAAPARVRHQAGDLGLHADKALVDGSKLLLGLIERGPEHGQSRADSLRSARVRQRRGALRQASQGGTATPDGGEGLRRIEDPFADPRLL